jgi:hypothetical protein
MTFFEGNWQNEEDHQVQYMKISQEDNDSFTS